ncbi:MAG: hypothetical protein FWG31_07345 [Oscillospiraceae bacterium]|nr:hypothetical protein [Oscillospiraceae bacterium]
MRSAKKLLALVLTLTMALSFVLPATAANLAAFDDGEKAQETIDGKSPAKAYDDAVQLMLDLKVITGSKDMQADGSTKLNLNLDQPLTRAEFAVMLYKAHNGGKSVLEGHPSMAAGPSYFGDVEDYQGGWAKGYTNWFASRGISRGIGDVDGVPMYGPGQEISFAEAILLCMRSIGLNMSYEEGFSMSLWSVVRIADEMAMLGDLYWMDDQNENGDYVIDRATACLLLMYTIETDRFEYDNLRMRVLPDPTNPTDRKGGASSLLVMAYNYTKMNAGTITSDGRWFSLDGTDPGTSGEAKVGGITLSADLTEEFGIDMYDVGRKITFWYRNTPVNGKITQAYTGFTYNDSMTDTYIGVGSKRNSNNNEGRGLLGDARALVRNNAAVLTGADIYINYQCKDTDQFGSDYGTQAPFNAAASLTSIVGSNWDASGLETSLSDVTVRMVYSGSTANVDYVFIEFYNYAQFRDFNSDNSNRMRYRNSTGFTPDTNARQKANIKDFPETNPADYGRFLVYEIGTHRLGYEAVTEASGQATVKAIDLKTVTIGGTSYKLSPILKSATPSSLTFDFNGDIKSLVNVGTVYDLFVFNGKVLEVVPPKAEDLSGWKYGLVTRSDFAVTTEYKPGGGFDNDSAIQEVVSLRVNILDENNSQKIYSVRDILYIDELVEDQYGNADYYKWVKAENKKRTATLTSLSAGEYGSEGTLETGVVGSKGKIAFRGKNYGLGAGYPFVAAKVIDEHIFEYIDHEDGTVTLREVAAAVNTTQTGPMSVSNNILTGGGWGDQWSGMLNKTLLDNSVIFVKDGSGNFSAIKARNFPTLGSTTNSYSEWVSLTGDGKTSKPDENATYGAPILKAGFVKLSASFAPPTDNDMVISLAGSEWEELNFDSGKWRMAKDFLTQDGTKITLYGQDEDANAFDDITGKALVWKPTFKSGSTNVVTGFTELYSTNINVTASGRFWGVTTGSSNLLNVNGVNVPFNENTKFFDAEGGAGISSVSSYTTWSDKTWYIRAYQSTPGQPADIVIAFQ